ncbi:DUF6879 family protein [Amycolatopsis anabasis]|uniref:DUF6879 family protein n=1 Tax=Amycolatopsis anabasis TaxID=1840409 RepID=UPI00131DED86|nr:DUF6879 family protein [Amycolatopsis anabasis]
MTILDGATFSAYFDNYQRSAWRFETQPVYTMPSEQANIARFLAGEPKPPEHNEDWHEEVREYVAAGKTIGRVRTVRQPLTDYQRYQLAWGIPGNVEAGEDIRILDLTEGDLGLSDQDFWLFDDSTVVHLNFNQDGTLANLELVDNTNDVPTYLVWRETALKHAVPFSEYART